MTITAVIDGKERILEVEEARVVTVQSERQFLELEVMKDGKFRLCVSKSMLERFTA